MVLDEFVMYSGCFVVVDDLGGGIVGEVVFLFGFG